MGPRRRLLTCGVAFATVTLTLVAVTASSSAAATPVFRQQASATPRTGRSVQVTYSLAELAADTNVVIVGWHDATSTIQSVTDSAGNKYQVAAAVARGARLSQAIYYSANVKAAAARANKVKVAFNVSVSAPDVRVLEYSGLDPVSPFDGAASASGSSVSARSAVAATFGASDVLVGGGTTRTFFSAAGAGYTKRVITSPDGDIAEDRLVTAAGNYGATATLGVAGAWVMQLAAFKAASTSTTTTTTAATTTTTTAATTTTTTTAATTTTTTMASDPRAVTGAWTAPVNYGDAAGIMQHAVLIPNTSKILFFEDGASTFILDTNTGAFASEVAGNNLFCAGQTVLADGRVMTLGGDQNGQPQDGLVNTDVYDPATNTWTPTAPMNYLRWYPTATKLADGRILATSGTASGVVQTIPEVYDPATNTWTALPSADNYIPMYPFMFVLPDGRIVQVGAFTNPTDIQMLDPNAWTWSTVDPSVSDAGSAVMYQPGKILRAGSSGFPGTVSQTSSANASVLDMTVGNPQVSQVASMRNPRAFLQMTVLPDDNVLVTGGDATHDISTTTGATYQAEMWSPTTQQWTTLASNQVPRYYHSTAVLLPDGRVLLGGGWVSGGLTPDGKEHSYEIFSPPYLFKGPRPTITSAPASVGYGSSFSVATPDVASISSAALIAPAAVTHNFDENARYAPLSFTRTSGGLQLTAPPNGDTAPPGQYMLFLVNSNGVPSVASWVTIH